ncbi:MAG: hypothetical protein L0191_19520, partial [Acidobacteria bacterium]|nr:hypothetical protein [Acidobacteriota bacterium]
MTEPVAATTQGPGAGTTAALVQRWGLLCLAGLALLVAIATFDPRIDPELDSAEYIVLGKALRAGLGMRYIHLPDAPRADRFPLGFPLLLAAVDWMAPDSLIARKALVSACYVGAVMLFFRVASTYLPPLLAFLVAALLAVNPFVVGMARIVMSEIPYLFCSLVAFWFLERALGGPGSASRWAWAGGVAALLFAAQVRTIGWSLLLAVLIVLLLRCRYRTLGLVLAGAGALVALMAIAGIGPVGQGYLKVWRGLMASLAHEGGGPGSRGALLGRLGAWALQYGGALIPAALLGIPPRPVQLTAIRWFLPPAAIEAGDTFAYLVQALAVALSAVVLALGAWSSLQGRRLASYYAVGYMAVLIVWVGRPRGRLVVPLIPFLFLFGAIGLHRLRAWARPRAPALDGIFPVLLGALVSAQLWGIVSFGLLHRRYEPRWREYIEMATWIRTHADPHDLILSDDPA